MLNLFGKNKYAAASPPSLGYKVGSRATHTIVTEFDPKDYKNVIKNNKVAIFSVTYCPHCQESKKAVALQG